MRDNFVIHISIENLRCVLVFGGYKQKTAKLVNCSALCFRSEVFKRVENYLLQENSCYF